MTLPLLGAGLLLLGGCAALGAGDPLEGFFRDGFSVSDDYGDIDPSFRQAGVSACLARASQYGQSSVTSVRKASSDVLVIDGVTVRSGFAQRAFTCSYRADGQIAKFLRG